MQSDLPIDAAVRHHARTRPDHVAFLDHSRELTWAELDESADQLAALLADRGVRAGDRVGWLGPNTIGYPVTLLGAWRLGASLTGLNWRLPGADLATIARAVDLAHVVADERHGDVAERLSPRTGHTVVGPGELPWDGHRRLDQHHESTDSEEAMLYFTSGSTGEPKAVPLTRRAVEAAIPYADVHEFTPTSRSLIVPPTFHAAGATWTNYGLSVGVTQVYTDDPTPAGLVATLSDRQITHAILVPTLIHTIVEELERSGRTLPDLKHVGYGASPITRALLEKALDVLGCDFAQVYGLTEAGGGLCFLRTQDHHLDDSVPARLSSAGRPGIGVEVEVRDPDGIALPPGSSGELWFRGPTLTDGYLGDEAATRAILVDGWLNTRDVGHLDEDGYVYVEGRSDDMILTGGENVHPQAVEEVLGTMPGVQECAVYGVPDEHWGQRVSAAVVVDPGRNVAESDITEYCRQRLPRHEVPRTVILLPELPRTATGKVVRARLVDATLTSPTHA